MLTPHYTLLPQDYNFNEINRQDGFIFYLQLQTNFYHPLLTQTHGNHTHTHINRNKYTQKNIYTHTGIINTHGNRGGRGQRIIHKSPKFYNNVFLFVGLTTLGVLLNFNLLVYQVECLNVFIVIYRIGNFVYHHWRCKSILSSIILFLKIPAQKYSSNEI